MQRNRTLREGDTGPDVAALQTQLGVRADGNFGPKTALAMATWQERHGLYADGVYGPLSRAAMLGERAPMQPTAPTTDAWARAPADKHGDGYDRFTLRADVAAAYQHVYDAAHAAGAIITSAGGRRNLTAGVSATRSATSLHYLGRALDLALYSGMVDPRADPYIITLDDPHKRLWRVWARTTTGAMRTLTAWTYTHGDVQVSAHVLDLTALFAAHGFERIPARPQFFSTRRNDLAAEWWHYQYQPGLKVGATTFGAELERVWSAGQLRGTGPWGKRRAVWRGGGFE